MRQVLALVIATSLALPIVAHAAMLIPKFPLTRPMNLTKDQIQPAGVAE
jgi:hypothetical protein